MYQAGKALCWPNLFLIYKWYLIMSFSHYLTQTVKGCLRLPEIRKFYWTEFHRDHRYQSTVDDFWISKGEGNDWYYGRHWHDRMTKGCTIYWDTSVPSRHFHDLNDPCVTAYANAAKLYQHQEGYQFMQLLTALFEGTLIGIGWIMDNITTFVMALLGIYCCFMIFTTHVELNEKLAMQEVTMQKQAHTAELDALRNKQTTESLVMATNVIKEIKDMNLELRNDLLKMKTDQDRLRQSLYETQAQNLQLMSTRSSVAGAQDYKNSRNKKGRPSSRSSFDSGTDETRPDKMTN